MMMMIMMMKALCVVVALVVVVDIKMLRDLPDEMSPYIFYIVFNDTTFIPFNRNEISHVNTRFQFHFRFRFTVFITLSFLNGF